MANIAVIFHWPPSEMERMTVEELVAWHQRATKRMGTRLP
ncbi:GpE family phage tail protein [Endozoicomonas sp. YOMI1]|nr:GpE family phage tail protein [Endozoicomonas sp. YOMI1]